MAKTKSRVFKTRDERIVKNALKNRQERRENRGSYGFEDREDCDTSDILSSKVRIHCRLK